MPSRELQAPRPPCNALSSIMNLKYMMCSAKRCREILAEGKLHLHFVLQLYALQMRHGRHVLHEHPESASSWRDPMMLKMLAHPRVSTVVADQCQYGLQPQDSHGNLKPSKKPTKFA